MPVGLMVLGSEMASFTIIGLLLDFAIGSMPWFTIGMTLFGAAAAFWQLLRMAKQLSQPPDSKPGSP